MRKSFLTTLVLVLILSGHASMAQEAEEKSFELVREEEGAKLYERWVIFPDSNPPTEAREVKGEFIINQNVVAILGILKDETKIKLWQHRVLEYKIYQLSDTAWRAYAYHHIPWPLSDQDHFLHYELKKLSPANKIFIMFKTVEDDKIAPGRKGVTRIVLAGSWLLDPVTDQQTKVTYRILSMPLGYPRFIVDPIIRGNLMHTIRSLIEVAEKK